MCKAALERFTTGLAQEVFDDGIGVNVISPGLVATPGVMHHKLINESNEARVTPVEHMAEACLRLCHGDPKAFHWPHRLRRCGDGRVFFERCNVNLTGREAKQ